MRDIHNIYVENSSVDILKQMYKEGQIKQIFLDFTKEDCPSYFGDVKYRIYDEFDYSKQQVVGEGPEFYCEYKVPGFCATYSFTDYTFIVTKHHKGELGRRIEDYSDKWVGYLIGHLSGIKRENYLKGLKGFTTKLSKNFEEQFLNAITNENQLEI